MGADKIKRLPNSEMRQDDGLLEFLNSATCLVGSRYRRYVLFSFLPLIVIISYLLSQKYWRPPFKDPKPLIYYGRNDTYFNGELTPSESCFEFLNALNTPFPSLLIDSEVLWKIDKGDCSDIRKRIKIGVDVIHKSESIQLENDRFEVVLFKNDTRKDYLDFRTEPRSIIPKSFPYRQMKNMKIPTRISQFLEFQKRSKFIACRNITMTRDSTKYRFLPSFLRFEDAPLPAKESIENLAKLRDEILRFGMIPFLNGGTLLGWFRECSVIPHTLDMDIGVFGEEWNEQFYEFLWSFNSSFTVKRQLGLVNDSYELTLVPKSGSGRQIDLFLMYKDFKEGEEYRWVGGLTTNGDKFKYTYPPYDPYCAGEMMGRIFWVTCTPDEKIANEYGPTWYLDKNSSKYVWYGAKNAERNGRFTRKQMMTTTYNEYRAVQTENNEDRLKESVV